MEEKLIAPCGINCAVCINHLAMKNELNKKGFHKTYCEGCIIRGNNCNFISHCEQLSKGLIRFCYMCDKFPCTRLKALDKRYSSKYHTSVIENQRFIKENGIDKFIENEKKKWQCGNCDDYICCHNGLCLNCDLEKLKNNKQYCWDEE